MSNIKLVHSGGNSVSLTTPTSNPSSNVTFKLPAADGTAGQVLQTDGNGNLSWVTPGVAEADQWRVTANFTVSGVTSINSNWERNDTDFDKVGTGMTESSGIFTFPSTGIYLIQASFNCESSTAQYVGVFIKTTTDNSSYVIRSRQTDSTGGSSHFSSINTQIMFDVSNVSTHKVKFDADSSESVTFRGDSTAQRAGVTFIRLGDT